MPKRRRTTDRPARSGRAGQPGKTAGQSRRQGGQPGRRATLGRAGRRRKEKLFGPSEDVENLRRSRSIVSITETIYRSASFSRSIPKSQSLGHSSSSRHERSQESASSKPCPPRALAVAAAAANSSLDAPSPRALTRSHSLAFGCAADARLNCTYQSDLL